MSKTTIAFAVALLIGLPVGPLAAVPAAAQAPPVAVDGAWARATPAGAENGAAYLTLRADAGDRLLGLSTPIARKAELHTMTMDGAVMKMRQLDAIELPAGQPVTLKPGGMHIMLVGLSQPLRAGDKIAVTLRFEKAGPAEISIPVEAIGASGPPLPAAAAGAMPMPMPMPAHH